MALVYAAGAANPGSQHSAGRKARQALEAARDSIMALLGARIESHRADRLIFTSGGTEANNLAILGMAGPRPAHAIVSALEHPSVLGPADHLRRLGWGVDKLPAATTGVVQIDDLASRLKPETRLVSIMLANNETGVLQPIAEAARICAERGVPLHVDAVQAAGKVPVDFAALGAAALTISAHKFHGPVGIGALILRQDVQITPQTHGGFQEGGLRPGTEPVALAVGMQAALEHWHNDRDRIAARMTSLRDQFETALRAGWPDIVIHGANADRLPHTSNVAFPGLARQALVMALDLAGVSCATGSACASGSSEPSPTLVAMGLPHSLVEGSLRFSLGQQTTPLEVVQATGRILNICNELRTRKMEQKSLLCRSP